jgi:uncharacterized repeat protein (TIGR01451 family)
LNVAVKDFILNLTKSIAGVPEGEVAWVDANELMTYTICFDNTNSDFPATNVSVVDNLPDEVRFIDLGKDTPAGHYDAAEHTYTWTFSSLAPGETKCLELNVQVKRDVTPGSTINNSVTVDSDVTPASMASAQAIVFQNPLNLTKRIAGVPEGQIARVDTNDLMTYTICFDNTNSDLPVTNVSVVDDLPDEVRFIDIGKETPAGHYDVAKHTYTWTFFSLSPGETKCLDLNVQVKKDVAPGTTIINSAIVDSDETPITMASAEAVLFQNPLNLTKRIAGVPKGQIARVDPNELMTYIICFDNTDGDSPVTNTSVVDNLPGEVRFIDIGKETPAGHYDAKEHTYSWTFSSLAPGQTICLELNVQVTKDIAPGTRIVNSVNVESDETPISTASVEAIVFQNPLNLTKRIVGALESQTSRVEANELMTYTICFDNTNSDLPVTNVFVVDDLPDEVIFIDLDNETPAGYYDATKHTYTWMFSSLAQGEAKCLELNVQVEIDVVPGTTITNSVIAGSDETPVSMVSVDAIVYQNPLNLAKSIVGVPEGQIGRVHPNERMTYEISFDNTDGDSPVTNVTVVDYLPDEVIFVGLSKGTPSGKYDAAEHTYTWTFSSLKQGETRRLELNVQVKKDVAPGMSIINSVIVGADETPSSTASVEAVVFQNPLDLTKSVLGTPEGETALVSADGPMTYIIEFDNNNDFTVTNISVVDVLPEEVSFLSAEGDMVFGKYDPDSHTYSWLFPSLGPGKRMRLELNTRVNKDLAKDTTFTNSVTVECEEAPPSTATADAIVGDTLLIVEEMKILPNIIRHTNESYDIQVSVIFPEGIRKEDISDALPILYPGTIQAKNQFVFESPQRTKVIALFDKNKLLDAVSDYGPVTLKMVGLLSTNHSYSGETTVYITKYTGS